MATILDYLTWRGELPISEGAPLNEVDAAILSRFSNLPFRKVYHSRKETMGSFCRVMQTYPASEFQLDGDVEFVKSIAKSERFSSLVVTDYVKHNAPELEMQFAAATIHLPDGSLFLSFCGTDSTLLGWKEDFNMSFQDNIPAQCAALSYAARTIKDYPDLNGLYLGGHSKGGNIATYAAVCLPEKYRYLVKGVYSCDGPGFSENFIANHPFREMDPIIHTFLPTGSLIGRILEHAEECDIIESSANNVWQHDMYTWQVEGPRIVRAKSATGSSDIFYNTTRHLIEETTPKQREMILAGAYSIASANASTPKEIQQNFGLILQPLAKEVWNMSREDWSVVMKALRAFVDSYVLALQDYGYSRYGEELRTLQEAENFPDAVMKLIRHTYNTRSGGRKS